VTPNNVVWFSIRPIHHINLTCRGPTLWMESLHPNLTSNWHNNDNMDNNPSPNRTNPTRIISITLIVHACFICLACYFLVCVSLLANARSRRIEDMERTQWSPEDKSRRHRNQNLRIRIWSSANEDKSNTHLILPSTLHTIPQLLPSHCHHILLASAINLPPSISTK
jgi:hypothetical protein